MGKAEIGLIMLIVGGIIMMSGIVIVGIGISKKPKIKLGGKDFHHYINDGREFGITIRNSPDYFSGENMSKGIGSETPDTK